MVNQSRDSIFSFPQHLLTRFHKDKLISNSFYMIASNFVMSVLGFLFWVINARLFTTTQIGIATTLISITGIITSTSMLGFNMGLIRYLPKSENKEGLMNTAFTLTGFLAFTFSILFLVFISFFSPKLEFLKDNSLFSIIFPFFIFIAAINAITDNVFIAMRSAKYILIINTIMSLVKLCSPFVFLYFGDYGIYSGYMLSIVVALFFSIYFIKNKFALTFTFKIDMETVKKVWKFSTVIYITGVMGMLSTSIIPVIITNKLNPESTAFYYMPTMILLVLQTIPRSISASLFAEGAHSIDGWKKKLFKSVGVSFLLLTPAIILVILLGKYILLIFGKKYSAEGLMYLQLSSLSIFLVTINLMISSIFMVLKKNRDIFITSTVNVISAIGLAYLLLPYGLIGIGISTILVQLILMVVGGGLLLPWYIKTKYL